MMAITPDARPSSLNKMNRNTSSSASRSVTFGGSLKTPTNDTTANNNTTNNNNNSDQEREEERRKQETIRQYANYRSSPNQFPSYERLRFVKLPETWLPEGLRTSSSNSNVTNNGETAAATAGGGVLNNNDTTKSTLQYWPCLVYNNLAELVRDLPNNESKKLKGKLILEHRKFPKSVVARLLGWNFSNGSSSSSDNNDKGSTKDKKGGGSMKQLKGPKKKKKNPFDEPKLELIRLSGSSLEEYDTNEGIYNDQLVSFVDGQLELENVCETILADHAASASGGMAGTEGNSGGGDNKKEGSGNRHPKEVDINVARHAYLFRNAVDMALNCLALDVGSDPLPLREDSDDYLVLFNTYEATSSSTGKTIDNKLTAPTSTKKDEKKLSATSNNNNDGECASTTAVASGQKKNKSAVEQGKMKEEKKMAPIFKNHQKEKKKGESNYKEPSLPTKKDGIPPLKINLDPNESWSDAWKKMRNSGWTWKNGSGLMTDYYYIKPGCKVKGGIKDQDYFVSAEDAKAYAKQNYGWRGEEEEEEEHPLVEEEKSGRTKTTSAPVVETKSKKKTAASSLSSNEKENQSNTATIGTKSRPTSGTQVVPPKFQSAKKKFQPAAKSYAKKDKPSSSKTTSKPLTKKTASTAFANISSASKKLEAIKEKEEEEEEEEEQTPWKDVWDAMKRSGWGWRGGSGLMTDYYYIKPGCKIKDGVQGQDYFVCVVDVQQYARDIYKWGTVSHDVLMTTIEEYAKYSGEVVPPLSEGVKIDCNESWDDAWKKMLKSGWSWKTGSGLMMDYYYIKPGCKIGKSGVEGQDYFVTVGDVQKFAKRNYGWRGDGEEGVEEKVADDGLGKRNGKRRSASTLAKDEDYQMKEKRQKVEKKLKPAKKEVVAKAKEDKKEPAKELEPNEEPSDDDYEGDEESVSDNQSTFSQSGFQTKKLFREECADENVPPLKDDIDPEESWSEAWQKMRDSGWTWKNGSGLMTDYYYIKPGCNTKGGVKGQDFFVSVEDAKAFARRNYGWRGEASSSEGANSYRKRSGSIEDRKTAIQQQQKRAKVEKTISKSVQQSMHKSFKVKSSSKVEVAPEPSPKLDKKALWQAMQKEGWRAISAGKYNALHDWYYVRPGCDPGDSSSKLGVDYFLCESDAIDFEKASAKMSRQEKKTPKAKTATLTAAKAADGLYTPADCQTKPQDPAIPLLSSPESVSSTTSEDFYDWSNLWPFLERAGWTSIKAGRYNPLHDWYYVRPKRDPGNPHCKLGTHYFLCSHDVIKFVRDLDEKESDGKKGGKKCRKSMGMMLGAFEEAGDV